MKKIMKCGRKKPRIIPIQKEIKRKKLSRLPILIGFSTKII
jgi:hypothetical protein